MLPCVWFSDRSKKTSKCYASCVTFLFLPHFDVICDLLLNRHTATWNLFVLYNRKKQTTTEKAFFLFPNLSIRLERRPLPRTTPTLTKKRKRAVWHNLLSIQMKQSHWLLFVANEFWLVEENHATVKLDSSVASHGMKTYSESRIELRNLQNVKKMQENCHQSSPVSPKA